MAISTTCPGCQAVYPVPENLAGKTIRCKKCGEMMAVIATRPAVKAARAVVADDDAVPAAPARRRVIDDEDEDAPVVRGTVRPEAKKKSALPLILGLGVGLLVLAGAGVGGLYAAGVIGGPSKPTGPEVVQAPPVTTPPGDDGDGKGDEGPGAKANPAKAPAEGATETKVDPPTKAGTPAPLVVKPIDTQAPPPQGGSPTTTPSLSQDRLMAGTMDKGTSDRVSRAAVLILGEGKDGASWTGSGWFGVEQGLVFTNAHVLNMTAPDAPPPTKLTLHLYRPSGSGARIAAYKEIPHSKIKILGVDRHNDLAVLQILNETDLPTPLKVKPSAELQARQGVTVFGFPLTSTLIKVGGLGKGKMPEMSVRPSTITALREDDLGRPRYVQFEGGSNPGNSGGPIVDAEGAVVAVVVAGVNDVNRRQSTQISLGVPTEWVFGLLAGRVDDVEFDQPYRQDGQVRVPVKAKCLDPLDRLKTVGLGYWVGDKAAPPRTHGEKKPDQLPADSDHKYAELKYDPKTKTATGELVYPELKEPGRAYWTQAKYTNSIQPAGYWMPGQAMKLSGSPVDRVAADLTFKPAKGGTRPIELSNSNDVSEYFEGEGEARNERNLIKTDVKLTEAPGAGDTRVGAAATLRFKYNSVGLAVQAGASEDEAAPKRLLAIFNENISKMEALAYVNPKGAIFNYLTNLRGVENPILQLFLKRFSDDSLEALAACSIPLPNKTLQPLETWEHKSIFRLFQIEGASADQLLPDLGPQPQPRAQKAPRVRELKFETKYTYTYLGMRERLGRREAVVRIDGAVGKAPGSKETASGHVKGYAMVEVETGTVVFADLDSEFEVDSSSSGNRKKISGVNHYVLTRGSVVK